MSVFTKTQLDSACKWYPDWKKNIWACHFDQNGLVQIFFNWNQHSWMSSIFMKQQNDHNSPGWTLILKIKTLLFLQLSKLKKIKCHYFFDPTSDNWDISFLWYLNIWSYVYYQITNDKIRGSSYLSYKMSDQANNGTLFSSSLKVGETKMHLFSWSEFILVSYGHFFISQRYQ